MRFPEFSLEFLFFSDSCTSITFSLALTSGRPSQGIISSSVLGFFSWQILDVFSWNSLPLPSSLPPPPRGPGGEALGAAKSFEVETPAWRMSVPPGHELAGERRAELTSVFGSGVSGGPGWTCSCPSWCQWDLE